MVVVNKQIKLSEKDGAEMMYASTSTKRMARVMLRGPKVLSDVTQSRRYAVFICGEIPLRYAANAV